MKTFYLICDESGAKGYSDKKEQYAGEVGVMAGFVFPEEYLNEICNDLDIIISPFFDKGKGHITDLAPSKQEQLRNNLFSFLKEKNLLCIYEAIHSEGFHLHHKMINDLKDKVKEQRSTKIKLSSNRTKELLHEHLFQGLFGKAIALCTEYTGGEFHLVVITDTIDTPIKERFEKAARELLSFGKNEIIKTVTGYDPLKKEVVEGKITSKIEDSNNSLGDFSIISFTIQMQESSLTIAADVIANSISHHFKSRGESSIGKGLNTKDAIKGHPLEGIMFGLEESGSSNDFADKIFVHPKNNRNT